MVDNIDPEAALILSWMFLTPWKVHQHWGAPQVQLQSPGLWPLLLHCTWVWSSQQGVWLELPSGGVPQSGPSQGKPCSKNMEKVDFDFGNFFPNDEIITYFGRVWKHFQDSFRVRQLLITMIFDGCQCPPLVRRWNGLVPLSKSIGKFKDVPEVTCNNLFDFL